MTQDSRKRFEKIFAEASNFSQMKMLLDLNGLNYPKVLWHQAKYFYKLLRTFKVKLELREDFEKWIYDNVNEIADVSKVSDWIAEDFGREDRPVKQLNHLNNLVVYAWMNKHPGIDWLTPKAFKRIASSDEYKAKISKIF